MKNINQKDIQTYLALQAAMQKKKPKKSKRKSKKKSKKSESGAMDFIGLCLIAGICWIGYLMATG